MRPDPRFGPGVPRRVTRFRRDEEGHWTAELDCGHTLHLRHDPPWQSRPWVLTPEGRAGRVGMPVACLACGKDPRPT